mmetsp:Transcript_73505/g.177835  ORF Transcript_73505/g.177835 Transcript_73505/m.177835 type:complete len:306 (-) Transcript_73505:260-1177(-)
MLARFDGRNVDRLVHLVAHVKHHDGAVVATDGEQRGVLRVKIEAHNARLGGERVLRVSRVLERKAAEHARALAHEIVAPVSHREEVGVLGVPAHRGHLLTFGALSREPPQRQQAALAVAELVRLILPVLEVLEDLILLVLVDHALEDLQRAPHGLRVDDIIILVIGRRYRHTARRSPTTTSLLRCGLLTQLVLVHVHVRVVNVPLSDILAHDLHRRWLRADSALAHRRVERLGRALRVVELVLASLYDRVHSSHAVTTGLLELTRLLIEPLLRRLLRRRLHFCLVRVALEDQPGLVEVHGQHVAV